MSLTLVNKIIPFSSVDGPGNRLALFLQGCNIDCLYCHNPETINICNNCGICVKHCPSKALVLTKEKVNWDKSKCMLCDNCIKECPYDSSPRTEQMTIDDIIKEIDKVRPFIQGITVSGGECTLQMDFLKQLFKKIRNEGLTCFIDTNGTNRIDTELMDLTDKFMIDLKAWTDEDYIKLTGTGNDTVLENIKNLGKKGKIFEIRTVIVPSCMDVEETVLNVASLIASIDPEIRYKLIKYRILGVREGLIDGKTPTDELMESLKEIAEKANCSNVVIL